MNNKTFLKYIGGLRGLAITLILLFHVLPQYFSQGYLGVDIFLVISGFLLFKSYNQKSAFNFLGFIYNKIKRIYPLLGCTIIVTCVLMTFALYSTDEARVLYKTIQKALCGTANFYFDKTYTNYFSDSANLNPLLHLWYLAVIMQVYIIWATGNLIVSSISKLFPNRNHIIHNCVLWSVIIISLASFFYSHSLTIHDILAHLNIELWNQAKEVPYWNTFGRIWQVAAGGLVFILPTFRNTKTNAFLAAAGILLMLFLGFSNISLTPYAALLMTTCTVFVLRYLPLCNFRGILEFRAITWVGAISFSLYLIHFPLLVFYKRYEKLYPNITISAGIICASLISGYLMWRFIEKRKIRCYTIILIIVTAIIGSKGLRFYIKKNIEPTLSNQPTLSYPCYERPLEQTPLALFTHYDKEVLYPNDGTLVLLYDKSQRPFPHIIPLGRASESPEFVLIGDSNAQHLYSGMNELCHLNNISGVHLTSIVIPLIDRYIDVDISYKWNKEKCHALYDWLSAQPSIHTVVISQLWRNHLFAGKKKNWHGKNEYITFSENSRLLKEFCKKLHSIGKHVVLVMPSPLFPNMNKELCGKSLNYLKWMQYRNKKFESTDPNSPFVLSQDYYNEYYKEIINLFNEWENEGFCSILHIETVMFENEKFLGLKGNTLWCRDCTHITPPASIDIMMKLETDFQKIIQKGRDK